MLTEIGNLKWQAKIKGCALVYRYTKERNINECVTTSCMDMKTIGIPPCTGTPGQPQITSAWHNEMQASLEDFFAPKPLVVTLMVLSRSVVASEKYLSFRQSVIIIIFLISWHVLLFLYSKLFSTRKTRGGVRSMVVLEMSTKVHISDLYSPWKWPHGVWGQENFQWGLRSIMSPRLYFGLTSNISNFN